MNILLRKITTSLIAVLWLVGSAKGQADGSSWASTKADGKGELSIIYFNQAGLIEKNSSGQLQGVCVDLLNQFVGFVKSKYKKDITLKYFQEEDFNEFYKLVNEKKNSLGVGNISITEERKTKFKFTPAYMPNVLKLITNSQTINISKTSDLSKLDGYTAYMISSSISEKMLQTMKSKYMPNVKIVPLESGLLTLEAVSKDPKGFAVIDFTELITAKRKNLTIKAQAVELEKTEEIGFMMSKKTDWDALWKEFLTPEFLSGSEFKKSFVKYFGTDFFNYLNGKR